jgi:hypothetical protein
MNERDCASYIEDIIEHMNLTAEFPELRPMIEKVLADVDL